jgi:diacylglycerol kinase family enzyme
VVYWRLQGAETAMHFVGVFNRDGGTFKTMDMGAFCLDAKRILSQHGHTLDCHVVAGADLITNLTRAVEGSVDVLLAGGGDGTISAAAGIAFRHGVPLGVLPAGTMNLFARALQMPLALPEALEALAGGSVRNIDIATANDRPFVHQYSVGVHTRLVRIRDGLTYHSRWGKILASLRAMFSALVSPPRFEAEIRTPRGTERRSATEILISNNAIGEGHFPHADRLDGGVLAVYIAEPMSGVALLRLGVGLVLGHWKGLPEVTERQTSELTLRFPRLKPSAQAVVDGELIELEKRVDLKIHAKALKVLAPASGPP